MDPKRTLLAFGGSLRKHSFNTALLKTAAEYAPPGVTVTLFDLAGIPLFSEDIEGELPPRVIEFKAAVRAADALLIATPEYNYSIPGYLKNAIDFATRPYGDNPFAGKPVAILGATVGTLGTARAQYHLRQVCTALDMHPLNKPEVLVSQVQNKLDDKGRIVDPPTREFLHDLVVALLEWTKQLQGR